jgi:hypothetical protein
MQSDIYNYEVIEQKDELVCSVKISDPISGCHNQFPRFDSI